MATPPMLASRDGVEAARPHRPDPVVSLAVGLLTLLAVGLLVAGVLAVYDYTTPAAEWPVVVGLLVLFGLFLAFSVAAVTVRYARRLR